MEQFQGFRQTLRDKDEINSIETIPNSVHDEPDIIEYTSSVLKVEWDNLSFAEAMKVVLTESGTQIVEIIPKDEYREDNTTYYRKINDSTFD